MAKSELNFKSQVHNGLWVALGCVPGSFIRWQVANNLFVNIAGAAILGLFFGLSIKKTRYLLFCFGFCGSLTTFSGFIIEFLSLLRSGEWISAYIFIFVSIGLGLLATACGFLVGRYLK